MKSRFPNRFPGEPSVADDLLRGCCSLELKLTKFAKGDMCLLYMMTGELLCTGDVAEELGDDQTNTCTTKAKRQIAELLGVLLDDEGRAGA